MNTDIRMLQAFFAAINRNDMDAVAECFDPDIVRVEPEDLPTSGTYRGVSEVKAQFARARDTWAEGSCDPEKFHCNGDHVVGFVHVRVRLHGSSEWIDARIADGFVLRAGKIVRHLTFVARADALHWAGIRES